MKRKINTNTSINTEKMAENNANVDPVAWYAHMEDKAQTETDGACKQCNRSTDPNYNKRHADWCPKRSKMSARYSRQKLEEEAKVAAAVVQQQRQRQRKRKAANVSGSGRVSTQKVKKAKKKQNAAATTITTRQGKKAAAVAAAALKAKAVATKKTVAKEKQDGEEMVGANGTTGNGGMHPILSCPKPWDELETPLQGHLKTLGFNRTKWMKKEELPTPATFLCEWDDIDAEAQMAAIAFGCNESSWNDRERSVFLELKLSTSEDDSDKEDSTPMSNDDNNEDKADFVGQEDCSKSKSKKKWSSEEIQQLRKCIERFGNNHLLAFKCFPHRSERAVEQQFRRYSRKHTASFNNTTGTIGKPMKRGVKKGSKKMPRLHSEVNWYDVIVLYDTKYRFVMLENEFLASSFSGTGFTCSDSEKTIFSRKYTAYLKGNLENPREDMGVFEFPCHRGKKRKHKN